MIDGVELKKLTTYPDERGFFREVIRSTDQFFEEGFGQWSHSVAYTGTIKAWHIHQKQVDWWYCPIGVIRAVLVNLQEARPVASDSLNYPTVEFLLGENQPAQVLRIPPGVAHGLKVLQGPAHLFYITSRVYDPEDEGRIPFDALGYDWFRQDIR